MSVHAGAPTPVAGLRCPRCGHGLRSCAPSASLPATCSGCDLTLQERNGIVRALAPDHALRFEQFLRDYRRVRAEEGRGSSSAEYYLALPFADVTGRNRWQWKIRARTFACWERRVLPEIERSFGRALDVLDAGAGNCWLSYRLALRGHRPVALDLLDDDLDGLGAGLQYFPHLPAPFPRFQADMDRLPFGPAQFDAVVFNASFHYSVDYEQTLAEAARCLRRPGYLVIADSPCYSRDASGRAMVEEKHAEFQRRFGFRSDSLRSREYLTPHVLEELASRLGLRWNVRKPHYGVAWAMRPVAARLLGRRERAKFHLLWTRLEARGARAGTPEPRAR